MTCLLILYRYLYHLKKKIKNKARVEGSIVNAYLVEETSNFMTYYFESHVATRSRRPSRHDDGGDISTGNENLSIFTLPRRVAGRSSRRWLTDEEYNAAHLYVLLNCSEVEPFVR